MLRRTVAVAAALAALVLSSSARAQKPPKPACGIQSLPFVQGTEWVYEAVSPPNPPKGPLAKPKQPSRVTIKVVSIQVPADKKADTEITLEETAEKRTYTTKLTCHKDALFVPLESFFFSGEPGGGLQLTLGPSERKEGTSPSYVFTKGKLGGRYNAVFNWSEEVKTSFTRIPSPDTGVKLAGGSLDLQRNIVVGGATEPVATSLGQFDAVPLMVDLRGAVILDIDGEKKEFQIPANTVSKLWFAENIGVVQVYNTNVHMYQLAEVKTPEPAAAAPKKK